MTRAELEHVIRASGAIAEASEIVVIGSQAILGSVPEPPPELTVSMEADLYPLEHPERADLVDGSIGEKSLFHETFGYYAHGIGPETAVLPAGWRERLVPLQTPATNGVIGRCLSPEDIAVSKLIAGRDKDKAYVRVLFAHALADRQRVEALIASLPSEHRQLALTRYQVWAK
ncbi:MAG: DUF6036 family nucleotidyltransferase [Candidatus Xenobia bacterium]